MLRVTPLLLLASGFAPRHTPSTRHGVRRRVGPAADEWPELTNVPLPAKLAGGLFLFKTSVPAADKPFAGKLLAEAQQALRDDPRVTMELGAVSDRHSRTRVSPRRRWLTPCSASCSALGPRGRRRLFERLELTRGRRRRA